MIEVLSSFKKVHFVGIGGIGISAIARMLLLEGRSVTGSDESLDTPVVLALKQAGAVIYNEHRAEQVTSNTDLLIYSLAIPADNPERAAARQLGIRELSYPEALGLISKGKFTIAVAGTHGKTTTTAMLADVLVKGDLDPTVIVGSLLKRGETNLIVGRSEYFLVEACEYRESFLNLTPQVLVITNIDDDHLDYYQDLGAIEQAFAKLATKLPPTGYLICDSQNERLKLVITAARCQIIDYRGMKTDQLKLQIPGAHNRSNAAAALAVASVLEISPSTSLGALNQFKGTWRRFESKGETKSGALLYDDYAHHPTEIKATLEGVKSSFPGHRIVVAFQPHLYSRTKLLLSDFASAFASADELLILPIYAARETPDPTVSSELFTEAVIKSGTVKAVKYFSSLASAQQYLEEKTGRGDLVLTMGAGDIFALADNLRYNQ
ncbi:MAG: Mur ligase domain-containing protein [Patescibacteria group bacterium]